MIKLSKFDQSFFENHSVSENKGKNVPISSQHVYSLLIYETYLTGWGLGSNENYTGSYSRNKDSLLFNIELKYGTIVI